MSATARLAERVRALPTSRRARRVAAALGAVLVVVAVLGFLVAPPLIRSQAQEILSRELGRPVTIEGVSANPFAPSLTVRGLAVREKDGPAVAAGFAELYVRLSYTSLFRLAPVVSEVTLDKPELRVVRNTDRTYNFQDLIDRALAPKPPRDGPEEPVRFSVNNIRVTQGRVAFEDAVAGEKHEVTDLRVGIPFVSSLPSHVDINVQPELSAKVNGAPLGLKGETLPFKDTAETSVDIDLDALSLPKLADYSPVPLRFRLASGTLDTRLRVRFVTRGAKPVGLTVTGGAGLSAIDVRDRQGAPLVAFERFAAELDTVDVFGREVRVRSLRLDKPFAAVSRSKDGRLNVLEALPEMPAETPPAAGAKPAPAPESRPLRFSVEDIAIAGGQLSLADLSVTPRPFRTELGAIDVRVKQLANHSDRKAQVAASFSTDGLGSFRQEGSLALSPVRAEGRVAGEGFRLARIYPYLEPLLNLDIADGSLDFEAGYSLSTAGAEPDLRIADASATVRSVVLRYPGEKEPFVRLPLAQVKDATADLAKRRVVVGEVVAKSGVVNAHREADGTLKFARLLKAQAPAGPAEEGGEAGAGTPWRIDLRRSAIESFAATFTDDVAQPPVVVKVTRIQGLAENWSNAPGTRATIRVGATVNGTGTVSARGPVTMAPFSTELDVEARRLGFAFVQPYLDRRLNLAISSGSLTARGKVRASAPPDAAFNAGFRGDVTVADFASVDRVSREDFANWRALHVGGIDFSLSPFKAHVGEIALSDFYARLILSAAGRLNLEDAVRAEGDEARSLTDTELRRAKPAEPAVAQAPAPAASPAGSAPPAAPMDIRIGRVVLQGGHVAFSDFFVRPNYAADLRAIEGSVSEMTAAKPGVVELAAKLDGTAPVAVAGRLNALSPDLLVDLSASAKDIELPAFSPYAIKYAGYGIERGKLSVRLKYLVENRKLAAENNVYLDQLAFGPKVESPTATKLPVLLAVSLLKDAKGVIDIDLPISGSIDDPQFSVWGIIGRVIVNLIAKAATAPFALLGAAFGGGGEELAYLEFEPGRSRMDKSGADKLAAIAKALANRPGLKLDIAGRADPASDREALRRLSVERAVKAEKAKSLAKGGGAASLDEIEVSKDEYPRWLKAAYQEAKFPRPRNFIGMLKDLPTAEMEALMLANAPAGDEALRQLANARALAAKDWLVGPGAVAADRVFLVAPKTGTDGIADKGRPNRADFALK